jgi:HAD superfamily hydrolase (TIGR01509 family)
MLKAVIFDMDGVLIDSEPLHHKAMEYMLEEFDVKISEEYNNQFIGSTTEHMLETIKKDFKLDISLSHLQTNYMKKKDDLIKEEGLLPVPFTKELIIDLFQNNIKLAIASSSTEDEINDVVNILDLSSYFEELVSGTTVPNPKPAPDVFLKAVKQLGVTPKECIIIEDSYNGVAAANHAGIPVIGFINENSGNQDLSSACNIIDSFKEVDYNYIHEIYNKVNK